MSVISGIIHNTMREESSLREEIIFTNICTDAFLAAQVSMKCLLRPVMCNKSFAEKLEKTKLMFSLLVDHLLTNSKHIVECEMWSIYQVRLLTSSPQVKI